ncbi:TonB-dependent receptor [Leptospira perolatii]|uniref:TonB-dependent receptor n=1 Tax=Leptospira perolatii TaxID=2023191 RepID=A0A2M9ZK64_9LEPT|nr:TonB-dependent receptor [Leptospira perolatii]PJZ69312.1 TonB-dependent receptor [Leptospira perolatii]PJZ72447.1 TonB-dependent receptor [Leptospira perolatii]
MRKLVNYLYLIFFLFLLIPATGSLWALDVNLRGIVNDPVGKPIGGAKVFLVENKASFRTLKDGRFEFEHLSPGLYTFTVTAPNYEPRSLQVELKGEDKVVEVVLQPSFIEGQAINVTAKSNASDFLSTPQPTTVLEGRQLDRVRGQNIISSLENTPGVATMSTGAGTAKPVIRGLTGQRVLVMTDGVRQEEQQFGDDHTVDLDAFNVDRIEVVRGPSSVLYGSDALGGVVNVIRSKTPTAKDSAPLLAGTYSTNSFSNNKQDAQSISLFGYQKETNFGYRIQTDTRKAGRITTPRGTLPNTGFKERNLNASVGTDGSWGDFYVDSFARFQEQDLYNNPNELPGAKSFQTVYHQKNHIHAFLILPYVNVEIDGGYQRNNRREIEDKNRYVPIKDILLDPAESAFNKGVAIYQVNRYDYKQGLNVQLDTTTLDTKIHHKEWKGLKGTLGLSGMQQRNSTIGTEALIPGSSLSNIGFFLFEEWKVGQLTLSAGARTDKRSIDVRANSSLGNSEQTRNFEASTGTAGIVWRFAKSFAWSFNSGKGFRAPTAFELFANGVHEGTGRFEIGNSNLNPETSFNLDSSVRFATEKVQAELSLFENRIQNYIYSVSAGAFDPDSRLPIYRYRQDAALLKGGEFSLQAQVANWLVINAGVDILRATIRKNVPKEIFADPSSIDVDSVYSDIRNKYLPRMTPNRGRLGFRFVSKSAFGLKNPYFLINATFVQAQYKVDKLETPTAGYNLYDIGFGAEIPGMTNGIDSATFDVSILNIFDKEYVSNLSRYKDYALNPGMNVTFKTTIPFTLISN